MPTKGERREFERLKALFEPAPKVEPEPADTGDDGQVIVFTGKKADSFLSAMLDAGSDLAELLPGGDDDQGDDDDDDDDDDQGDVVDPPAPPRNRFFATRTRG